MSEPEVKAANALISAIIVSRLLRRARSGELFRDWILWDKQMKTRDRHVG
jgi:hypothetical protein